MMYINLTYFLLRFISSVVFTLVSSIGNYDSNNENITP